MMAGVIITRNLSRACLIFNTLGLIALFPAATFGGEASAQQGPAYLLEHSFGDGEFSPRGTITLRSTGSNQATISQQFNAGDAAKLYELAQNGGYYLLRVSLAATDNNGEVSASTTATLAQTFVPACAYYQSNMIDSLVLFVDEMDQPQSIQINTASPCKSNLKKRKIVKMKSHLNIRRSEQGPLPFLEEYLEEAKKKQTEASEPPQGFLQKYWMYLLPVYLFVLMNRLGGGGEGEGGSGGAGAAAE